jgi:EmrB/QacA subfamily drug resistance transporter
MKKQMQPQRWLYFLLVATGVLLSTMDSSMINVALPSIMRSFSASLAATQMVVLVYLSTITIFLVFWGHLSDIWGRGQIYLKGMLIFAIASCGCYLSLSLSMLIAFRFLQGLGAAMMMASGPAIIKMVFPVDQLGRGLGLVGLATSFGLMCGPVISGFLIHFFSWRLIFLVTLPLSLSMCLIGHIGLLSNLQNSVERHRRTFDWPGFVLWGMMVVFFVVLVSLADNLTTGRYLIAALFFIALISIFLWMERRAAEPLIPVDLFRKRYFSTAMITAGLSFAVLFVILLLIPFYLDYILELSSDRIGLIMLSVPVTLVVVSPLSGWLYDQIGARMLTTLGLAVSCLAILSMLGFTAETNEWSVAARLALLGTGQAIFLSPNSASVLAQVSEQYVGIAAGLLATARNLGMLLGVRSLRSDLFGSVCSFE